MKAKIIVICCLILQAAVFSNTETIQDIRFEGLQKTRPAYLMQFLESHIGAVPDSLVIHRDVQVLRNLQLFLEIDAELTMSSSGYQLVFQCQELITLLPIINFGGVSNNFWFQLGGADYNWRGEGNTLGGYYRYYDRHSFAFYSQLPYLFNRHWGLGFEAANFSTTEPAYFDDVVAVYDVDHRVLMGAVIFNPDFRNSITFSAGYLNEQYNKNPLENAPGTPGPDDVSFDKMLYKLALQHHYIDYFGIRLNGFANATNIETVKTGGEKELFWKVLNVSRWFAHLGKKGNLAMRFRAGISTNKDSPFVPFLLDSYLTVRGSGNRVARGTAEFTLNAEYRHTLKRGKMGAFQWVFFSDISAWRPAGQALSTAFREENNVTFFGSGFRLQFRRLNNFIFRVDYGFSVTEEKGRGFVIGAGQYF